MKDFEGRMVLVLKIDCLLMLCLLLTLLTRNVHHLCAGGNILQAILASFPLRPVRSINEAS